MEKSAKVVVRTVRGDVDPADLGITLCHEHLIIDLSTAFGDPDLKLDDPAEVAEDLADAKALGLRTVVDVTPLGTGRDAVKLARISELAGLHVVASAGYYFGQFLPDFVAASSEADLAGRIAREVEEGIDGSTVRAGAVGEVGNSPGEITDVERKVFRAAGRAQRLTGAAVITHTDVGRFGADQLDLLEIGGADLSRVLIGHMDCTDELAAHLTVARRGAFVGFDRIGVLRGVFGPYQTDETRARLIAELVAQGHASQIILSHDIARRSRLRRHGGQGYSYILRESVPLLRQAGLDDATIRTLLIDNPRRLLAFEPRR